jgi:hypothetical protein
MGNHLAAAEAWRELAVRSVLWLVVGTLATLFIQMNVLPRVDPVEPSGGAYGETTGTETAYGWPVPAVRRLHIEDTYGDGRVKTLVHTLAVSAWSVAANGLFFLCVICCVYFAIVWRRISISAVEAFLVLTAVTAVNLTVSRLH